MARRSPAKRVTARPRRAAHGAAERRARTPQKRKRRPRRKTSGGGGLFRFVALSGLVVLIAVSVWLAMLARDLPDTAGLIEVERAATIAYYDHDGRLIARRGSAHGRLATIEDMPSYLIDAVLAVEDRRFYSHPGVDAIGTGRALLANLRAGRVVQGGSTLTQQLAKNLFLSPERTMRRKVQEMMLAFWLESQFTKDEILELYLNRVYFGGGAWGVEAAATRYFGRPARELSLGEAALLAGLLKAPSRYSPVNDAERAAARATVVLDLMTQTGRITQSERVQAAATPIRVTRGASSPGAQYFIDWVAADVRELVGADHGDLIVRTTLDVDAQRAAERSVDGILGDPDQARGASEGALVSVAHDGSVRAMVGGRNYVRSQFNRAVLASRQPGSAFKPFVYASAFEAGLTPADVRDDAPVQVGDWAPQNYNGEYRGRMTLREAFARSSNAVAVRIAEETGRGHIARLAVRFGIESPLQIDRALALGAYEVTPLEMASAYAPFANGGIRARAYGIAQIETTSGEVLYQAPRSPGETVIDQRTLSRLRDLMQTVVRSGTGRAAAVSGLTVGGKTGTTNDFRDAWFAGYAGDLVTVVWTGNDDNSPTERATGGGPPARIFASYNAAVPRSGLAAAPHAPDAIAELVALPEPISDSIAPLGSEPVRSVANTDETEPVDEDEDGDAIASFLASLGRD
jgi:penicillin-binding protein 1A